MAECALCPIYVFSTLVSSRQSPLRCLCSEATAYRNSSVCCVGQHTLSYTLAATMQGKKRGGQSCREDCIWQIDFYCHKLIVPKLPVFSFLFSSY